MAQDKEKLRAAADLQLPKTAGSGKVALPPSTIIYPICPHCAKEPFVPLQCSYKSARQDGAIHHLVIIMCQACRRALNVYCEAIEPGQKGRPA